MKTFLALFIGTIMLLLICLMCSDLYYDIKPSGIVQNPEKYNVTYEKDERFEVLYRGRMCLEAGKPQSYWIMYDKETGFSYLCIYSHHGVGITEYKYREDGCIKKRPKI